MNSLQTRERKPSKTCLAQSQQRDLPLYTAISKDVH